MIHVVQLEEISSISKGRKVTKHLLTPWNQGFEKPTDQHSHRYSRISQLMVPSGSTTCSEEPITGSSLEPDESHLFHPVSVISVSLFSFRLHPSLPSSLLLEFSHTSVLTKFVSCMIGKILSNAVVKYFELYLHSFILLQDTVLIQVQEQFYLFYGW